MEVFIKAKAVWVTEGDNERRVVVDINGNELPRNEELYSKKKKGIGTVASFLNDKISIPIFYKVNIGGGRKRRSTKKSKRSNRRNTNRRRR